MNGSGSREVAAECAGELIKFCSSLGASLQGDPRLAGTQGDPVIMGLILLLAGAVMEDKNWDGRHDLFAGYGNVSWPLSISVRQRIDELLDGVGLRADHWNLN